MGPRYVAWLRHHFRLVLVLSAITLALSIATAARLELKTEFKELLPTGDPRVAAVEEVERRLGSLSSLILIIESPDPAANRAYADQLSRHIEATLPTLVERALWQVPEVYGFFHARRWLFASETRLAEVRDRLEFEIARAKNPLFVPLEEPPSLESARSEAERFGKAIERIPGGRFETDGGHSVTLVVLPGRTLDGTTDERLARGVRQAVASLPPPDAVHLRYSGSVESTVEERRALEGDLLLTSTIVLVLVASLVGLYFGRLRAIPLMTLTALCGLSVAMAFAKLAFGHLNASTAFLGAIIMGNGINYPILTMARYAEERHHGRLPALALERAVLGTARATSLAAFAASAAYGSLALTRFRGFSQFGAIGAIGMTLCWVATMTFLPAALWALDRKSAAEPDRPRRANFGSPFALAAEKAPTILVGLGATLTLVALAALPRWLADPFEYDFRKLRTVRLHRNDAPNVVDAIFGRALSPSVLLTSSRAEAERAATVLRERAKAPGSPIAHVVTLDDLLPGSLAEQERKLRTLAEIRRLLSDPAIRLLSPEKRERIRRWRPPPDLAPIREKDLPRLARRPFEEKDGAVGRVVLVYPPTHGFSLSNGRDLVRLADVIRDIRVGEHQPLQTTGRAVIFAGMIQSIAHDGPIATAASFAAVTLLTAFLFGGRGGGLLVLTTLVLGVLWMIGVAALFRVKVNFLNFVALPITFGIGVDYAANLYFRYRREGGGSVSYALRSTGGAVALNSATTILGYGSLLLAHNRALVSFGSLAILGELACLAAALLVMPALIILRDRRRAATGRPATA